MFCSYAYSYESMEESEYKLKLALITFEINPTENGKINVYSLNHISNFSRAYTNAKCTFDEKNNFFIIQTKSGRVMGSILCGNDYSIYIYYFAIFEVNTKHKRYNVGYSFKDAFHKLLFVKGEIILLAYYSNENSPYYNHIIFAIFEFSLDNHLSYLSEHELATEYKLGSIKNAADIILINENKFALITLKWYGKKIIIIILSYFNNYENIIMYNFNLNIYEQKFLIGYRYSLLFKYKDFIGLNFENIKGENGFILFGYFNSTDQKQIYNIKKDGLNYVINLGNYLTLQSNVFGYKKKCIKIIEVPNLNESGIYLISNNTNQIIKQNDYINLNTEIKINFAYNGIIKKGNYLFKFCGVVEEETLDEILEDSDWFDWDIEELNEEYYEIYDEQRKKILLEELL